MKSRARALVLAVLVELAFLALMWLGSDYLKENGKASMSSVLQVMWAFSFTVPGLIAFELLRPKPSR